MPFDIVTGTTIEPNVSSADDRAFNASVWGPDCYVLPEGSKFAASIVDANTVLIQDGNAMFYGAHCRSATVDEVKLANGASGQKRHDIIGGLFERLEGETPEGATVEYEMTAYHVIQGEPVSSPIKPEDPDCPQDSILDGATEAFMPLYRAIFDGLTFELEFIAEVKEAPSAGGTKYFRWSEFEQLTGEVILCEDGQYRPEYGRVFTGAITAAASTLSVIAIPNTSSFRHTYLAGVFAISDGGSLMNVPGARTDGAPHCGYIQYVPGSNFSFVSLSFTARTNAPFALRIKYYKPSDPPIDKPPAVDKYDPIFKKKGDVHTYQDGPWTHKLYANGRWEGTWNGSLTFPNMTLLGSVGYAALSGIPVVPEGFAGRLVSTFDPNANNGWFVVNATIYCTSGAAGGGTRGNITLHYEGTWSSPVPPPELPIANGPYDDTWKLTGRTYKGKPVYERTFEGTITAAANTLSQISVAIGNYIPVETPTGMWVFNSSTKEEMPITCTHTANIWANCICYPSGNMQFSSLSTVIRTNAPYKITVRSVAL